MKHFQKTLFIVIIGLIWILTPGISLSQSNNQKILFIAENAADNQLVQTIAQKGNFSYDIIDIKPVDDLNLVLNQNYLENYHAIFLVINQISTPFNNTLITSITDFVNSGNLFG
ncbi:MAG: hypothetical protein ACTSPV_13525, partial [Candidatus Hodarchaeales archaeon]